MNENKKRAGLTAASLAYTGPQEARLSTERRFDFRFALSAPCFPPIV